MHYMYTQQKSVGSQTMFTLFELFDGQTLNNEHLTFMKFIPVQHKSVTKLLSASTSRCKDLPIKCPKVKSVKPPLLRWHSQTLFLDESTSFRIVCKTARTLQDLQRFLR